MSEEKYYFGYLPDPEDKRDYPYKLKSQTEIVPIDMSAEFPPIKNQGKLSSCTAFAVTSMVEYVRGKQKLVYWDSSPLFTYYSTRKIEGTEAADAGAYIRDAIKSVASYGATKEELWPYDETKVFENPLEAAWQEAEKHQALVYYRVEQTRENILGCLAEGYPFAFGVKLYESFITTQTGMLVYNRLPMPATTTEKYLGGHCMLAVGFVDDNGAVYVKARNSWGVFVGLSGYHYIPLEYLLNPVLASDFWTIRLEESSADEVYVPPAPPEPAPAPPSPVPNPNVVGPAPTPTTNTTDNSNPSTSIWKNPLTYFMIVFILIAMLFVLLK